MKFIDPSNKPAIKFIALHHTLSFNSGVKQHDAVNIYHRDKNWGTDVDPWYQPGPTSMGSYIAYNFFADVGGERTQTRAIGEETLAQKGHNCDVSERCDTISYCMSGDFRYQLPSNQQEADFLAFISEVRVHYPDVRIVGHRDLHAGRTCPELPQEHIDRYNKKIPVEEQEKSDEIERLQRLLLSSRAESNFLVRLLRGCK